MALTIGVRNIRRVNGRIYITFTDKVSLEFDSMQALRDWVQSVDGTDTAARDLMRRVVLAAALLRDPTGAAASVEGKRVTLDLTAATPLEIV